MTKKYFLIWFRVVKKYISYKYLIIIPILFIAVFLDKYILITFAVSVIAILAIRLFNFYRKILELGYYDLLKLKPISPLFGLLVYQKSPFDVFILFPILIYLRFKESKK